ncbi:hypothetical protein [Promicromonospora sp. NPDC023987]|uniref:hypothetical protein n=1 Tax=Promicromonospora sp. NPDC023987 TaxID=3155360 RepID=UPI0033DA8E63
MINLEPMNVGLRVTVVLSGGQHLCLENQVHCVLGVVACPLMLFDTAGEAGDPGSQAGLFSYVVDKAALHGHLGSDQAAGQRPRRVRVSADHCQLTA